MVRETYNTDCRDILKTLADESIDGVFTDPPYNVALQPQRGTHGKIANDALSTEDFYNLLHTVSQQIFRVLKPNRAAWFCCNWECISDFIKALKDVGFSIENCVVWVKNNFGIGYHLRPQHEFILLCHKGEVPKPEVAPSNVWHIPRLINTIHPTEKPVQLVQTALKLYNHEGDVILDPFAGSLSTPLAAKQLGMGYIAIELDKEWYEPGIMRLETGVVEMTNSKGKLVSRIEGAPLLEMLE